MPFNPDTKIADSETLYRAIYPYPKFWKIKNQKVSSAAFKSESGLSVDRDGDRQEIEVIQDFRNRNFRGNLIYIGAIKCREIGTHLISSSSMFNPYHAEIHDSESTKVISDEKCELLSQHAQVISEEL